MNSIQKLYKENEQDPNEIKDTFYTALSKKIS
jgi:hypothetical protein